jgi:hypothetical protein
MSGLAGFRRLFMVVALALLAVPAAATANGLDFPFDLPTQLPAQLRDQVPEQMAPNSRLPFQSTFVLEAGDGYRVGVIGVGDAVVLEVIHGHALAMTAYVARGTVTPGRLEASFGKFGRVAMRFQPSGQPREKQHRPCKGGGRFLRRSGVFVGSVRFRGEDGYLSVDAHRGKGQVVTLAPRCWRGLARPAQHAIRPPQNGGWGLEITSLSASWRKAVSSTSFAAIGFGSKALFFALSQQSQGPLAIFRIAIASAARAFTINDPLTLARVSPPAPFYGTGTYRAAPDGSRTWTGKLAANFPGAPRLSLTGPQFKTKLDAGF